MANPRTRERWKALAVLVALVVAVDAAAIAVYLLADLRRASPTVQFLFAVVWTVVTVGVVMRGMRAVLRR
jgi:NO-binding membrane sensor protein with MHYT domain